MTVVRLAAFPLREIDASASGNGRSAGGPCEPDVHNFTSRPASRPLSLLQLHRRPNRPFSVPPSLSAWASAQLSLHCASVFTGPSHRYKAVHSPPSERWRSLLSWSLKQTPRQPSQRHLPPRNSLVIASPVTTHRQANGSTERCSAIAAGEAQLWL